MVEVLVSRFQLLLFVASILDPLLFPRKQAEDPRAGRRPGSLTRFVLGLDSNAESIMDFKPWPITALDEANGNCAKKLISSAESDWFSSMDTFLSFIMASRLGNNLVNLC